MHENQEIPEAEVTEDKASNETINRLKAQALLPKSGEIDWTDIQSPIDYVTKNIKSKEAWELFKDAFADKLVALPPEAVDEMASHIKNLESSSTSKNK